MTVTDREMKDSPRNAFPTVICDVCDHEVEYMETFDEWGKGERVLRVRCHGEWDEMRISDLDILRMTSSMIDQINHGTGHAFTQARIRQKETPDVVSIGGNQEATEKKQP